MAAFDVSMTFSNGLIYKVVHDGVLKVRISGEPIQAILDSINMPYLEFNTDIGDLRKMAAINSRSAEFKLLSDQ